MTTVIVVESPAKARKIQKYFDDGTKVISSFGHIYDLPKDKISIDIENNFKPNYKPIHGKTKIIKELRDLSKDNNVLLAADDDREGDAIAWHCGKVMKVKFNEKNRIIFHEISKKAIQKAIKNRHSLNMNSVNAQQARRITDRLVGYSLSPCLWKNIQTEKVGLSAGRVQSTLLKILKEHEDKINNFESEYEYDFTGDFEYDKNKIDCELLFDIDDIEPIEIMKILKKDRIFNLISSKKSEEKKYPGIPFITSSLQQSAQNELGFPVKMTMDVAQKLYENGKITYMRTDSTYISKDFQKTIEDKIINEYSKEYYKEFSSKAKKVKGAQEAHECIRPTNINHELNEKWQDHERKLYNLIKKRTIISHMKPAVYNVLTIDLSNKNMEEIGIFRGKFKNLKFAGYLIYSDKNIKTEKEIEIPRNSIFNLKTCICKDIESQPPQYYNESTIVKKLESSGIGRPSTYASIIATILNRKYTVVETIPEKQIEIDTTILNDKNKIVEKKEKKKISPQKNRILLTDLGKIVLEYLLKHFSTIINVEFTSLIEQDLDKVAEGSMEWTDVVRKVYNSFYKEVEIQMKNITPRLQNKKSDDISLGKYKNNEVLVKNGRYGPYLNYNGKNINLKYILQKKEIKSLTINDVKNVIDYPMNLGKHDKKEVTIHIGPYGKYMKYNGKNIKIPQKENYKLEDCIVYIK
jgi:DNA topoisomerase I